MRQEGRAYAVLPLSLVLWKLMLFSPSAWAAWTFNCRNLSKPCHWNSRWAATYCTALLILNLLLSEGVLQNKDQKQILSACSLCCLTLTWSTNRIMFVKTSHLSSETSLLWGYLQYSICTLISTDSQIHFNLMFSYWSSCRISLDLTAIQWYHFLLAAGTCRGA